MLKNLTAERIHVAVGIIYNPERDKVLISKRSGKQHLAGFWEFPGGKVKHGEDVQSALARELFEELGLIINQAERLSCIIHDYSDKKVLLDVWSVNDWSGNATGCEAQEIIWVPINSLNHYSFPEANKSIMASISLPSIYLISEDPYEESHLLSVIKECFAKGLKIFQFRLKHHQYYQCPDLINEIKAVASFYRAKFILNGIAEDIEKYCVDGIHFNQKELLQYSSRPIAKKYLLGASCHNEKELIQATLLDVDYGFISPVRVTKSHPEAKALGWHEFSKLAGKVKFPVYALGGLSPSDLGKAESFGAHGIAMLSAIWGAEYPARRSFNKVILPVGLMLL